MVTNEAIDLAEVFLAQNFQEEEAPLEHEFVDGIYVRKIFMRAGIKAVSKIHKKKHPFIILTGDVSVFSDNEGEVRYKAPYYGVTLPGTRRMLVTHEDTIWITFHCTPSTDLQEIEEQIIEPHVNPALAHERILQLLTV